jgi:hypothetical protein
MMIVVFFFFYFLSFIVQSFFFRVCLCLWFWVLGLSFPATKRLDRGPGRSARATSFADIQTGAAGWEPLRVSLSCALLRLDSCRVVIVTRTNAKLSSSIVLACIFYLHEPFTTKKTKKICACLPLPTTTQQLL